MFQRVLLDFVLKTFGLGAENETRTRDPNLGKVVLYQLSYFRITFRTQSSYFPIASAKVAPFLISPKYFAKKIKKSEKYRFAPTFQYLFWFICRSFVSCNK